jgi:hypothetical protein
MIKTRFAARRPGSLLISIVLAVLSAEATPDRRAKQSTRTCCRTDHGQSGDKQVPNVL